MTFTDNEKAIINSSDSVKLVRLEFPDGESEIIGEHQIYQESLNLEESIFDGDNLTFGKCNGSIFKIRVADFTENIENARMNVYVKFTHPDLGEVDVPFGKYIISQPPERTSDRRWRDITATDYMTLFDVDIAEWYNTVLYPTNETRTVNEILDMLCKFIGVKYNEDTKLINGSLVIGKTVQPTSLSGRDLLQNICEINACFGHFDWNGVLQFITLDYSGLYPSETLYPSQNLYPRGRSADSEYILTYKQDRCNYEDYDVKEINSVSIIKEDGGLGVVYKLPQVESEEEVENRYIISGNILLYEFNTEDLQIIAQKICNKISACSYRPNSTEIYGGIYMSLGQSYVVNAKVIVGSNVIDNTFESYVLKRTITGIQAMSQVLEAQGELYQPETQSHDILSELTILKGRSAVYKRDLDGLTVEFKDFEQGTSAKFDITDQAIESEVKRAKESETELGKTTESLSARVSQTESDITAEVTRATIAENGIKEDYGSRFEQTADSITSEVTRATNAENGLANNISNINSTLSSKIEQTAESITSTVAGYQTIWDEADYYIKWKDYGITESIQVESGSYAYPIVYDYYLDVETGLLYRIATVTKDTEASDEDYDYYNITLAPNPIQLKTTRQAVSTEIEQTATSIRSEVSTADNALSSRIEQTLKSITLAVEDNGTEAGIYITTQREDGTSSSRTKVGTITLEGLVRFTNLSTAGQTTINGGNITTGYINADRINGGTIRGQSISGGTIDGANITSKAGSFETSLNGGVLKTNRMQLYNANGIIAQILAYSDSAFSSFMSGLYFENGKMTTSGTLFIGNNGSSNVYADRVVGSELQSLDTETSSEAANCRFTTGTTKGLIRRATGSSIRYKHDFKNKFNEELSPRNLYDVKIYQYKYQTNYLSNKDDIRYDKDVIGFIVEELERHYPVAVDWYYDEEKKRKYVTDWNEKYIIPPMLKLIQEQHKEIENLKEESKTMKSEIATLQEEVVFLMERMGGNSIE